MHAFAQPSTVCPLGAQSQLLMVEPPRVAELSENGWICDLVVIVQHVCFGQDDRKRGVASEGQAGRPWIFATRDNTKISVRRSDLYVQGTEVNGVAIHLPRTKALLHKSGADQSSPFPGRTYPMASVTGTPRAVERLSTAMRIWISATCRSKSRAIRDCRPRLPLCCGAPLISGSKHIESDPRCFKAFADSLEPVA